MNRRLLALSVALALTVSVLTLMAGTEVAPGTGKGTVNKSLEVEPGTVVKDVKTVNGSSEVGDGGRAEEVSTVNGSIRLGNQVGTRSIETVNGAIRASDALTVADDIETVNRNIEIGTGAAIGGSLATVNGSIRASQGEVRGRIVIENPDTRLYVHETARVGAVEGATAQPFQAEAPE